MAGQHAGDHSFASRGVVPVAILVALIVAVVAWRLVDGRDDGAEGDEPGAPATCPTIDDIVASPEVAPTVRAALSAAGCDGDVEEATSADVEQRIEAGDAPDVWIPDSSVWPTRLAAREADLRPELIGSVASSPVVVVAATEPDFDRWADVILSERTVLGDPLTEGTATLALLGAQADAGEDAENLQGALVVRAQSTPPAQDVASAAERLAQVEDLGESGPATIVSEQQWLTDAPDLVAEAPGSRAPALDYPVVVLAGDEEAAREEAAEVARRLEAEAGFSGDEVVQAREEANLRAPDLVGVSDGVGAVDLVQADSEQVVQTAAVWSALSLPINALAVLDVSGSMNERIGEDGRRLEVAVGAALVSLQLFSDRSSLGLWEFGLGIGSEGRDYRPLVPIAPLGSEIDGATQRERVTAAATAIRARPGVGTGLYDTVLAAYRTMQENYDPDAINSVMIITDGRNEDPDSPDLAETLEILADEADPDRPIGIYMIGISADADADALEQIAQATGGASHVAVDPGSDPDDLADLFRSILAQREVARPTP